MKISKVTGCTAFSLNVDGKEEVDMTNPERYAIIDNIAKWLKNNPDFFNLYLQAITEYLGDYEVIDDEPCECCGDTIDAYILEIED